jgi:hypothetical protein
VAIKPEKTKNARKKEEKLGTERGENKKKTGRKRNRNRGRKTGRGRKN